MITGDNVETARAIGCEIGLLADADEPIDTPAAAVLTSARFNDLTDDELKQQLPQLRILARARPLDKFRMVKLLQELGEVVAVTGDGTNDAPALKKADVGLAMGIAGTEVAKEASKIVLLDDAFSTIVKAVHWGRSLYENIQRFIQFQLTINVSAPWPSLPWILFFGVKAPFTVLQLLWINVIMDTFASIALCSEPPRPGVMRCRPSAGREHRDAGDGQDDLHHGGVFRGGDARAAGVDAGRARPPVCSPAISASRRQKRRLAPGRAGERAEAGRSGSSYKSTFRRSLKCG